MVIATGIAALTTGWARKATPEPGGGQHRQIVGAVADRERRAGARPRARARRCSSASLLRGPRTGSSTRPVSRPPAVSSAIGLGQIEADRVAHPLDERREAARHQRRGRAAGAHRPDQGRGRPASAARARDRPPRAPLTGRPASSATRAASAARKSSSPFIARRVIAATSARMPATSASSSMHSTVIMVESMSLTSSRLCRSAAATTATSNGRARDQLPDALAQRRRLEALDRELAGLGGGEPAGPGAERARRPRRPTARRGAPAPDRRSGRRPGSSRRARPGRCAPEAASR